VNSSTPQPTVDARGVAYAGFWIRAAASVVDLMVVCAIAFFLGIELSISPLGSFLGGQPGSVTFLSCVSLWLVVAWLYSAIMESSSKQATVGKEGLGLIVTDIAGGRISFGNATVRYLGKIASALSIFIGFIFIGFTANKRGLHDRISGTAVVVRDEARCSTTYEPPPAGVL